MSTTTPNATHTEPSGFVNRSDVYSALAFTMMKVVEDNKTDGKKAVKNGVQAAITSGLSRYLENSNFLNLNSFIDMWEDQYTYNFALTLGYELYCSKSLRSGAITALESSVAGYLGDQIARRGTGDTNIV